MRILGIVALAAALTGCGVVARMEDRQEYVKARQQYEESTGAYRTCLARTKPTLAPVKRSASRWSRTNGPSTISQVMLLI
jgi:hypothetical protein